MAGLCNIVGFCLVLLGGFRRSIRHRGVGLFGRLLRLRLEVRRGLRRGLRELELRTEQRACRLTPPRTSIWRSCCPLSERGIDSSARLLGRDRVFLLLGRTGHRIRALQSRE